MTACILVILLTAPIGQYILHKASPVLLRNTRIVGIAKSTLEDMEFGNKPSNGVHTTIVTTVNTEENERFQRF
ncbi:hypothetical protein OESDEN_09225 [Oesophagostomum dentatum]|uniref:Uncharacterized protein n=1 Tax=Oesophagostomum dentatum TaxID=61180 RepID=A0A0B1T046_OESDE|nr:hypothetical protein OESDEN_09225 [Oesophagostomum dentatum]